MPGIDWQDDEGVLDFHSLRHSTAGLLATSGVRPKTAQDLMRHSDINLTMSRYTHTLRGQAQEAIESLPDLSLHSSQRQKATGTDDKPVDGAYRKI
jgi:integrase